MRSPRLHRCRGGGPYLGLRRAEKTHIHTCLSNPHLTELKNFTNLDEKSTLTTKISIHLWVTSTVSNSCLKCESFCLNIENEQPPSSARLPRCAPQSASSPTTTSPSGWSGPPCGAGSKYPESNESPEWTSGVCAKWTPPSGSPYDGHGQYRYHSGGQSH